MIGRSTGLIIANTLIGAVLGLAALKLFAVYTDASADGLLGQLAFAMGLAGLLTMLLDMGLGSAHTRRVSEGRDLGTAVATYARAKAGLAVLFLAVVAAGAFVGAGLGILQDTPRVAILLVGVYFAFMGLRTIFTATFDGRQEFAKSQMTVLAENVTRVALMIGVGLLFGGAVYGKGPLAAWMQGSGQALGELVSHHGAEALAACYAVAGLASFAVGYALFRRGYPVGKADNAVLRAYWSFGRHVFLMAIVGSVLISFDRVVITAFWDPKHTGQYYGAQRFSDLISMVPAAVYTVLFPALSAHYARGNRDETRAAIASAVRHVSLIVVPLVVFAIALAGPLLSVVLTGQFTAATTLRVLAIYALLYAISYPYAAVLQALGRPDLPARAAVAATAINAVLNLALVPPAGALLGLPTAGWAETGAAVATAFAAGAQFLILRRAVNKLEGAVPLGHLAKHLVAGAAAGAVLLALAPPPNDAPWYLMLVLLGVGGAIYLAVLVLLREFTRHDLDLYMHLLDPAAMARHVSEEVQSHGPEGPRGQPPAGPPPKPGP
ncbi:MAG TPA: polysaccharide biosynthesis C-terminal domain-containing protein [Candidatus Thermoplasmatota archaeon]|jgi:O-antigen/teichoic acid export membrane protein|nr:polysaccharide biosynthesis C-terminal domain-containing protein [Candidatus Thermoplasmatota archaeon]